LLRLTKGDFVILRQLKNYKHVLMNTCLLIHKSNKHFFRRITHFFKHNFGEKNCLFCFKNINAKETLSANAINQNML